MSSFVRVVAPLVAASVVALAACERHQSVAARNAQQESAPGAATAADRDTVAVASQAAATLASAFRSVGLGAAQSGTTISVGGTQVSVATQINTRTQQAGRHIFAAQFDVSVGGIRHPELLAGSVGVGNSPDDARDTAIEEWAAQYGAPIGFALATRLGATGSPASAEGIAKFYSKVEVDGQVLFHGPSGARGEIKSPADLSNEFVRRIAGLVVAVMRQRSHSGQYRSATVQLVVSATAVTDGECRIDGVVSADLLNALSNVAWPEGSPSYMFKLFFVGPVNGG